MNALDVDQPPEYLDGPKLVAWLDERIPDRSCLGTTARRRITDWAKGMRASVWAADAIVVKAGYHLHELPEDLWCEPPRHPGKCKRARGAISAEERRDAVSSVLAGRETAREASERLEVTDRSVRGWVAAERKRLASSPAQGDQVAA